MTDEDDRRDVRSEAEGAVPHEKQAVTSDPVADTTTENGSSADGRTTEDGPAATSADDGSSTGGQESTEDESPKKAKKQGSFWKELPVLIGVALVLALVIKAFAVQAFYIPSASMENTLQIGDRVLVNKIVYHTRDIKRGDIVVFNGLDSWDPEVDYAEPSNPVSKVFRAIGTTFGVAPNEKDYIKRVIGIPGDRVKCCDAQGRITVNGVPLDEKSYLFTDPQSDEQNKPSNETFDHTVKPGQLWVMGDHREVSSDSRAHRGDPGGGTIPVSRVIGRAFVIVWPLDRLDTLPIPKTFEQPALSAAAAVTPAVPLALGFVGAVPVALIHRRLRPRFARTRDA
ncbi:signal peptidase I [Spirillospora sp. NPDC048911]|uniref:signal peptidase I n=1 Tax=Spirillospora sp. NPDC048911 TaxID=3364527 RepID=UPI00371B39C0